MSAVSNDIPSLVNLNNNLPATYDYLLNDGALRFIAELTRQFGPRRDELLAKRIERQHHFDKGRQPDFGKTTAVIRQSDFRIAAIPEEVRDRRTEITGPVNRKMVINALNSGAQVYMADFEDSTAPSWLNVIDGQHNLFDAVRRQIDFTAENGKDYTLNDETAVLMVRPRGLHLPEQNVSFDGKPIAASLLDFGLYLFHNHQALAQQGSRAYFYLPKLEHHEEAHWWADVIAFVEDYLAIEQGTVRVTVLIETLPAVFQMDEILYQLRDSILGLNCGRWDYIFSYIKTFRSNPEKVLPDRIQVGMTSPFLSAYSKLLIKTCHRRGAFAMGGMAAQIPIKNNPEANERALDNVIADKKREALSGHDGTWVAHPALEPLARQEFDAVLENANQIDKSIMADISAAELLAPATGTITLTGIRGNITVAIHYIDAWIRGNGCVPLNHLMEDAATAEIARAQLWQWLKHGARTESGRLIDNDFMQAEFELALHRLKNGGPLSDSMQAAYTLLHQLVFADELADFLTLSAYELLLNS